MTSLLSLVCDNCDASRHAHQLLLFPRVLILSDLYIPNSALNTHRNDCMNSTCSSSKPPTRKSEANNYLHAYKS